MEKCSNCGNEIKSEGQSLSEGGLWFCNKLCLANWRVEARSLGPRTTAAVPTPSKYTQSKSLRLYGASLALFIVPILLSVALEILQVNWRTNLLVSILGLLGLAGFLQMLYFGTWVFSYVVYGRGRDRVSLSKKALSILASIIVHFIIFVFLFAVAIYAA
jgi:hypothetical protein